MAIVVERKASGALLSYCRRAQEALNPRSKVLSTFREDLRLTGVEDHYDMLLRGVDKAGKPRAALAKRTRDDPRRGPGPSLIPRYYVSRFIANFEARWEYRGEWFLSFQYVNILSKATKNSPPRPFAKYHMTGATKPGTRWVLPKRDTGGITPKGWKRVERLFHLFAADVARYSRGFGSGVA